MNSLLSLVLILVAGLSSGAFAKTQVCSITINSKDEVEAFKARLGTKDYDFVELTDFSKQETEKKKWLDIACEQQKRCDILIISGHFGGSFFGKSGLSLSMDDLESRSCTPGCAGILQKPREVYLFGCNTLAGKERDQRTPEEYRRVLLQDGFGLEEAERIVAFRYSPIGDSFEERMRRTFRFTPRIYGFNSIAPSGENTKPYLKNYLTKIPVNYFQDSNLAKLNSGTNQTLRESFRETSLVQKTGAGNLLQQEIPICYLEDPNVALNSKLHWITDRLNEPKHSLSSIATIGQFLEKYKDYKWKDNEFEILEKVTYNQTLRRELEGIVKINDSAFLTVQLALQDVMEFFGWLPPEANVKVLKDLLFKNELSNADKDKICSVANQRPRFKIPVRIEEIPDANWTNEIFLQALGCISRFDVEIYSRLLKIALQGYGPRPVAASIALQYQTIDPSSADKIKEIFLSEKPGILMQDITEKLYKKRSWWKVDQLTEELLNPVRLKSLRAALIPSQRAVDQIVEKVEQNPRSEDVHTYISTIGGWYYANPDNQLLSAESARKILKLKLDPHPHWGMSDHYVERMLVYRAVATPELQDDFVEYLIELNRKNIFPTFLHMENLGSQADSFCGKIYNRLEETNSLDDKSGIVLYGRAATGCWSYLRANPEPVRRAIRTLSQKRDALKSLSMFATGFMNGKAEFPVPQTLAEVWVADRIRFNRSEVRSPEHTQLMDKIISRNLENPAETDIPFIISLSRTVNLPIDSKFNRSYANLFSRAVSEIFESSEPLDEISAGYYLERINKTDHKMALDTAVDQALKNFPAGLKAGAEFMKKKTACQTLNHIIRDLKDPKFEKEFAEELRRRGGPAQFKLSLERVVPVPQ